MAQNVYPPSPEFSRRAYVKSMDEYRDLCRKAAEQPEQFWGEVAERELAWFKKYLPLGHAFAA